MRFEEAYGGWQHGQLTQLEAASLLGVSDRTFRRYLGRYEEGGLEGLIAVSYTHLDVYKRQPQNGARMQFELGEALRGQRHQPGVMRPWADLGKPDVVAFYK